MGESDASRFIFGGMRFVSYVLMEEAYMRHADEKGEPNLCVVHPFTYLQMQETFSAPGSPNLSWYKNVLGVFYAGTLFNNAIIIKRRWAPRGSMMILRDGLLMETANITVPIAASRYAPGSQITTTTTRTATT